MRQVLIPIRSLTTRVVSTNASQKLVASSLVSPKIPSPRKLKNFLDQYIIGQEVSKKILSVAVYNHYLRIYDRMRRKTLVERQLQVLEANTIDTGRSTGFVSSEARAGLDNLKRQNAFLTPGKSIGRNMQDEDLELSKSNVMVIGPSGSGKTLLATSLARVLEVPIAIIDCTQLTQAGYIGEDVQICIERLLVNADYDVSRAERGIIVLDEVDKLAKTTSHSGTKDVSGEGVQQSLLKLIEGHRMRITVKRPTKRHRGVEREGEGSGVDDDETVGSKDESFVVDTSNILFMTMGAFVGLDDKIIERVNRMKADLHLNDSEEEKPKSQESLFRNTVKEVDVGNGKLVSALSLVSPPDLVRYGLIPELVGRVPIITALEPLKTDDLYHILKEPKNALLDQYRYIFKQFGVRLCITDKALKKVAEFALNEGTGARGLRGVMERLLLNINYECPESGISYVLINEETVKSLHQTEYSFATHVEAKYYTEEQQEELMEDVLQEDPRLAKILEEEFK